MTNYIDKIPSDAVRLELLKKPQTPANLLVAIEGLRCHLDDQHQMVLRAQKAVMDQLEIIRTHLRTLQKEDYATPRY